ncbi:HlyD family type I secretion periplasmic adaptor subunit [Mesorhizobium sp. M2D.F.Ca.ET.185.01.1.1]|uniref:HlyD family type I secretion periplasmic adaptor subunit n=1 Tax=unclassified Mesorhizobium TaxID=325217 RepID=UPI000FCC40CC|nr:MULTISPECIES: HlyD family type I secretion periplasmic adaptor subunit [unclassified Mesorhizobium]TGP77195.1 HlyD family type I secretion periplasmic adaptor subunit [bacterium M00.F.Ca.ET.227.01.1.1]TGP84565.1 HlyD family type I secretion periplasmic adaptor subunit [bacterium M00.F.Ca.ET.221.01.1.1]TGP88712.1 HlyD family type I secretion periplasmic adaptor subunit [bacterium M00.F.Ca.ET.222.01.1.1]TGT98177.1 HlyD family type I secretion periplasmic adaptor subunit [bacterium M00.F.Ca.ET.
MSQSLAFDDRPRTDFRRTAFAGYAAIALLIGGFGYWAASAPLAGAVITQGTIAATGGNILIQHREGGIIRQLLAHEGDRVREGQELILLDRTAPEADLNRLRRQWIALKASAARLEAERDGLDRLAPIAEPAPAPFEQDFEKLIREQQKEFDARLARFRSEQSILAQRVAMHRESVKGLNAQKLAIEQQAEVVKKELGIKTDLLGKGLTNRTEYSQLLRSEADLVGQAGALESYLASANTQIVEAEAQIERATTQRVEEALTKLDDVRTNLADIEEQMRAAQAVLKRTTITAPAAGIVVSSIYNSQGSVVAPGEKIMEILPTSSGLVVDAKLRPKDIDAVHVGQKAKLRLSALNTRLTPEVPATVSEISADRLIDEATHEPYFRARLKIADPLPASVKAEQLYPGTPVDAFISTGDRTFFEYLVRPMMDSFARAFRER